MLTLVLLTLLLAAAVAYLASRTRTAPAHVDTPQVKKSKYASVSSADFAPKRAQQSSNSDATRARDESASPQLDASEQADYHAARLHAQLHCTQLKAMQLIASAGHRSKFGRSAAMSPDELQRASSELLTRFPHYDASSPSLPSLRRFTHVREHTHCIFARKSKCWGSPASTRADMSVREQTRAAVPGLVDFTLRVKAAYPQLRTQQADGAANSPSPAQVDPSLLFTSEAKSLLQWPEPLSAFNLDAFVVEVQGPTVGDTLPHFARTVREVLCTLSAADPVMIVRNESELDSFGVDVRAAQCMAAALAASAASSSPSAAQHASSVFSSPRWHFSFLGETFFVTCFAPCYPSRGHARYMFTEEARHAHAQTGEDSLRDYEQRCFVLFQPELGFLRHNLSADTSHTEWDVPRTERDRIRVAFRKADREYFIPPTVAYPTANYIVPAMDPFSGRIVRWWEEGCEGETPAAAAEPAAAATAVGTALA